jgi:hypothetical protein
VICTARSLPARSAKRSGLKVWGSVLPNPFHIGGATMNGAVMTLARYQARQVIKRQLYAQGIKLASVESCEITIAANKYIDEHPEIIAFATEQYHDFVKRGILKPERKRRKASQ